MASILVVEDDADVAQLIQHRLAASGHEVAVAPDGEQGLVAARDAHPSLVILDWMMPYRTGLEVCTELRGDASFASTRIMMLTARTQDEDIARAFSAGADDFMTKPFSPRELVARVGALLAS
ncbi:response regulator transcription factor [Microbacterium sp. SORGH_AS_0862]|uniref:response regulator transcription factor n=1 Tax=Microbacterium sp. SORGH_AS_0862 TaxID=3041789 RepID=UPI002790B88F|nr:response regulator transcription factor [Microbacterium sp. SORGH_AS_0862]MDQ1204548.1 DNA-binding response OmpR family regulator [Microbacterium sp. SORGH_AS_0862]